MADTISLTELKQYLDKKNPDNPLGYGLSHTNAFSALPSAVFATPLNILAQDNDRLPPKANLPLAAELRKIISNAKYLVDITNLDPVTGDFWTEICWGIKEALFNGVNPRTKRLVVRFVFGVIPGPRARRPDAVALLRDLGEIIGFKGNLSVCIALQNVSHPIWTQPERASWNHSKYVAVDSRHLIVGGHNWYADPYLTQTPPFDLSVRIDGPAALDAHRFSDFLISESAPERTRWDILKSASMVDGTIKEGIEDFARPERPDGVASGKTSVLTVGQNGNFDLYNFSNPSLDSLHWAIARAKNEINISQMSLASAGGRHYNEFDTMSTCGKVASICVWSPSDHSKRFYDYALMAALAEKLKRNVSINILISNSRNVADYTNGDSPASIYRALSHFLLKILDRKLAEKQLREKCKISSIMTHGVIPWSIDDSKSKSNHAKFWSSDNMFYVGSHNMYPSVVDNFGTRTAHLSEWGVIMSDNVSVETIKNKYFYPIWSKGLPARFDPAWMA